MASTSLVAAGRVVVALCAVGASAISFRADVDACQCLNWKESYASGLVECGQGFEFTRALGYPEADYGTAEDWLRTVQDPATLKSLQEAMGGEFCDSFYRRFDDTKCARTAMDSSPSEWYGRSWCYVSEGCADAMAVGTSHVKAKLCEEGRDEMLSDMDPQELIAYGQKMGFYVLGYFVKVAYPVDRSFYYDNALMSQNTAHLATIRASGRPIIIDKTDEHQFKMIIMGNKVFEVPYVYEGFKCVEGCPEEIYSFAPKDGLICYQGPKDSMTDLYNRVRMGLTQGMFADSPLWTTPCTEHGFTLGSWQTCYGHTFSNTMSFQPHIDDERSYEAKFRQEHTAEEVEKASAMMGCASCQGHC